MLKQFLNKIEDRIGKEGLIFTAKAGDYFKKKSLSESQLNLFESIITEQNLDSAYTFEQNTNYLAVVLYYTSLHRPKLIDTFTKRIYLEDSKIDVNNINQLHLLYNIIEFADTFDQMHDEELEALSRNLNKYAETVKNLEDFIWFKYYSGIIQLYKKQFDIGKMICNDWVIDFDDIVKERESEDFFRYLKLKSNFWNWKILKNENDYFSNEYWEFSLNWYNIFKENNPEKAIKMGIIISDWYQSKSRLFDCILILEEIYYTLKKNYYEGNLNLSYSLEITFQILCRLTSCNIYLGEANNAVQYYSKLNKNIDIWDIYKNETNCPVYLQTKYSVALLFFKSILNGTTPKKLTQKQNNILNLYKTNLGANWQTMKDVWINIYAINSTDTSVSKLDWMRNEYIKAMSTSVIPINDVLFYYYTIYNKISMLTKSITTDKNIQKQKEYNKKIQDMTLTLIQYFKVHYQDQDNDIKLWFNLNYNQGLIINCFYTYIYSFYFENNFPRVKEELKKWETFTKEFECGEHAYYAKIEKWKGDLLYNEGKFTEAIVWYNKALKLNEKGLLKHSTEKASLLLSWGFAYLNWNDEIRGKKLIGLSSKELETWVSDINTKTIDAEDKLKIVSDVMQSLNM